MLFGGDTALHDGFADHAPIDLMLVGIGAYDPFIYAHANPEQAYEMARQARARHVAPMHHSVFKLSVEPMHEPLDRFLAAARADGPVVVAPRVGDVWIDP